MRLIGPGGLCEIVVGLPLTLLTDDDLWRMALRVDRYWYVEHGDSWWFYDLPWWQSELMTLLPFAPWRELRRRGYRADDFEEARRAVTTDRA